MAHVSASNDEFSDLKWGGVSDVQLEAFEARQRKRIQTLEEMLNRERQELAEIIAARKGTASKHGEKFVSQLAPQHYSTKLTWKDKILFVVKEAAIPIHGKEIGPALQRLQPYGLKFSNLDNTVSVHLTKLVRDGELVRMKRKGRLGAFYALPE